MKPAADVSLVAYETDNKITNAGKNAWKKETGLLSIWILGMFTPSPSATIVVPIKPGPESELGVKVTSDYFGTGPAGAAGGEGQRHLLLRRRQVPQQDRHQPQAQQRRARAATTRTTRC